LTLKKIQPGEGQTLCASHALMSLLRSAVVTVSPPGLRIGVPEIRL
jgi:hypothetical protein